VIESSKNQEEEGVMVQEKKWMRVPERKIL